MTDFNYRPTMNVGGDGALYIGGMKAADLAREYGTPLYVFDEDQIRLMMRTYKGAIERHYGNGLPLYASKAFSCLSMYSIAKSEGLGVDVVSGGELFTAKKAGFPMKNVFFHGNSKTDEELKMAVDFRVGYVVVDSAEEAKILNDFAKEKGRVQNILVRVNPGVEAHTHKYVQTATNGSKFGFPIWDGRALGFTKEILGFKNLRICGYHCHIGSQIFEKQSFVVAAQKMVEFFASVKKECGFTPAVMNLGGGFGIFYEGDDPKMKPEDYDGFVAAISDAVTTGCKSARLKKPRLVIEPGRSIVGEAGITLYTVNTIKNASEDVRYVAVDGGMGDNPRYALYESRYTVLAAEKADAPATRKVTIAGKCCESGDMIAADVYLPDVERGDILAVLSTGAYNYSMASNYNRNVIPGAILVSGGKADVIIKKQTLSDLTRGDVIPQRIKNK